MDTSQALCEQAQQHQRFFRQYQRLAYTVALRILKRTPGTPKRWPATPWPGSCARPKSTTAAGAA